MGRIKIISIGVLTGSIILISTLAPVTTFAKTRVKFVVRFPWQISTQRQKIIVTPVEPIQNTAIPILIATATPIPSPTPTPTSTPTPSPTIKPISTPTSVTSESQDNSKTNALVESGSSDVGDVSSFLLGQVNEYRKQNGLGSVVSDQYTCQFASTRALEVSSNFSHDGFNSRISSNTLPYSDYSYVNENIAQNSDITRVVASWIASPPHAENMRQNIQYACIRNAGEYYVFEGWRK